MAIFNRPLASLLAIAFSILSLLGMAQSTKIIKPLAFDQVKISDAFWGPKIKVWSTKTVYDVLDKLEGKYEPDRPDIIAEKQKWGRTRNAFLNFDLVAQGKSDTKQHDGPPWYDGLVYETIRGAADILAEHPDKKLEAKIDAYVERFAAAQTADKDNYLNTYTTLTRPTMRWGTGGGDDNWQHDVYNAGMLIEAAVHYYKATGKTKLLDVAVKLSNSMVRFMGPSPKRNVIPGHGGPEEAILKLSQLFKAEPALKSKMSEPVDADAYFALGKFWLENRGHYEDINGTKRQNFKAYGQDDKPIFEQKTIEGHAVRATLVATGVAANALVNKDQRYIITANNYWDNMIGKRLFITGGEGVIPQDEKFGPDYFLPETAYGETCASIGAAFFSARMNELHADGKYMDEFERVLYNNLLSGVSLSGDKYFYENPLIADNHKRWAWHDCPCCPPMILKMIGVIPEYIYAHGPNAVYVNLFIGSQAQIPVGKTKAQVTQATGYPWKGNNTITVNPAASAQFAVNVRVPGWAQGKENPFDLYASDLKQKVSFKLNGKAIAPKMVDGYATFNRIWKKGDRIEMNLPVAPRLVTAHDSVQNVKGKLAIAAGPVVYGFESLDNPGLKNLKLNADAPLKMEHKAGLLNSVNVISGQAVNADGKAVNFTAVPFYSFGNRELGAPYQVWMPAN